LKTGGEVGGGGAGEEVAVGIMPRRQSHKVGLHADLFQAAGQLLGRPLAGLVFILVKDEVNPTSELIGKLAKLGGRQTGAEGAGGVAPENRRPGARSRLLGRTPRPDPSPVAGLRSRV